MIRSTKYLSDEIDQKIVTAVEKNANDFSARFNHMTGLTDSLASYVTTSFDYGDFEDDRTGYLGGYKNELASMIRKTLSTSSSVHSLYVTFNPEFTKENDEVWYVLKDGKMKRVYADFKNNKRDFKKPYGEDMAYFFEPQNKKTGIWTKSYYDKDIKQKVFTYSRAIYVDGSFVGVAGADITAEYTIDVVKRMKLYDGGYAALLDANFDYVVHPGGKETADAKLPSQIKKKLKAHDSESSGIIRYTSDGKENVMGFSRLDNNWILIASQPVSKAFEPVNSLRTVMILLGIILAILLITFLVVFSMPFIKKQKSLQSANDEKEIMLIYQSRQAKTGEMMGNVTHQWKQPLNTINLILANLLDSYRYGDFDEERLQKSVSKVEDIVKNMSETIGDFSDFLKPEKEKSTFDIKASVRSSLSLMEESINRYHIDIKTYYDGDTRVFGYPNELTHVIFNILNNARDAIVASETKMKTIVIRVRTEGNMIDIGIANNGAHIPDEIAEKLFEPYFTTKETSGGTGLGLYISREIIVQRMDGKLYIENTEGGVCVHIQLPVMSSDGR
ncbi:MAG: sensor histidine kinase [Eubacteriaceae bacterium]|nr:sensor histidine kinase [Eubacteriaceae bacterium]